MPKLSDFIPDTSAVTGGEAITVGPVGKSFEITTRGFTPAYRDRLSALRREAARTLNRTLQPGAAPYRPDTLPPTVEDKCLGQALAEECIQGVAGLDGDDGQPVTIDQFRALLTSGDAPFLTALAVGAASRVGENRAEEAKAAEGN